jgi:putative glycerol-1-phosphate prenyltransferase
MKILQTFDDLNKLGRKGLAVLIDPDKCDETHLERLIDTGLECELDYFLVGGSLILNDQLESIIQSIKSSCEIPVVTFPGNAYHLCRHADGILFLSLISGRNPEYLIGQQVQAAPLLKQMDVEVISIGYMIVGNNDTTVAYISNTQPIPLNNSAIAVSTALAGEMLGLKSIYLDAGSGAKYPVPYEMIKSVKNNISIPLIVGGGIKTQEAASAALSAGADIIVIGNGVEKKSDLLIKISKVIKDYNSKLEVH